MKRGLGVCYYPEQWDESLWASDAARMAELGLTWLRSSASQHLFGWRVAVALDPILTQTLRGTGAGDATLVFNDTPPAMTFRGKTRNGADKDWSRA
jgi:hypothetical protein